MKTKYFYFFSICLMGLISCKKDKNEDDPQLIFKFKFDETLPRLNNFGNPAEMPEGHSAQSPDFKSISAHYIEFAPSHLTALGDGEIVYQGEETTAGGANAVDFSKAVISGDDETFLSIPLSDVSPGTYEWVRVSLTYQNYGIEFKESGVTYTGRLASFVGFNTYLTSYVIDQQTVNVNANKLQGYWGFETIGLTFEGQAPGTTVPNPIASTSPVPAGSCVVTGEFPVPLTISGDEDEDIVVYLNLSTNQSFEWKDQNMDGLYEPSAGETVVDMGLRGLYPTY